MNPHDSFVLTHERPSSRTNAGRDKPGRRVIEQEERGSATQSYRQANALRAERSMIGNVLLSHRHRLELHPGDAVRLRKRSREVSSPGPKQRARYSRTTTRGCTLAHRDRRASGARSQRDSSLRWEKRSHARASWSDRERAHSLKPETPLQPPFANRHFGSLVPQT